MLDGSTPPLMYCDRSLDVDNEGAVYAALVPDTSVGTTDTKPQLYVSALLADDDEQLGAYAFACSVNKPVDRMDRTTGPLMVTTGKGTTPTLTYTEPVD